MGEYPLAIVVVTIMMMKLVIMATTCEYNVLISLQLLKKKKKNDQLGKKKNWLNINLWETSVSNHYCLLKAWSEYNEATLLENDSSVGFLPKKKWWTQFYVSVHYLFPYLTQDSTL